MKLQAKTETGNHSNSILYIFNKRNC